MRADKQFTTNLEVHPKSFSVKSLSIARQSFWENKYRDHTI